jgi:hypothetical protein
VAIHTIVGLLDGRWMVALAVKAAGFLKHVPGTIGDAVPTSLAAFINNVDNPSRNQNFVRIQRHSPVFHRPDPHNKVFSLEHRINIVLSTHSMSSLLRSVQGQKKQYPWIFPRGIPKHPLKDLWG